MELEEKLARALCYGNDPDEILSGAHPEHPSLCAKRPRWRWKLGQAQDFLAMMKVFQDGSE